MEGIVFGNEDIFKEKSELLRSDGPGKLHIVADFDRTLTKGRSDKGDQPNSTPGLFEVPGFVADEIRIGKKELFQKYRPIELDPSMTLQEKAPFMQKWLTDSTDLYRTYKLSRDQLKHAASSGYISPRPRFKEFFEVARSKKIPILIFSAGIGDLIEEYLKIHGVWGENVRLIANRFRYDEHGFVQGWVGDVITAVTKNEEHASFSEKNHEINRRPNVLLLGDHAGDIHMADGARHKTVLSIGFLNNETPNLDEHLRTFDAVVLEDAGLDFPIKILDSLAE